VRVVRIGYVGVRTDDVDAMTSFFRQARLLSSTTE
jgi:hypothetical protein